MVQKFKELYSTEVIPYLKENFQYTNLHQIPKLEKIQINRGLGVAAQNKKVLEKHRYLKIKNKVLKIA